MSKRIKTSEVLPRSLSYARDLWLYYHYIASIITLLLTLGGPENIIDRIDFAINLYILFGYLIGAFGFILVTFMRVIELDRLEEEFIDPDPPLFCSRKKLFLLGTPVVLPFAIVYITGIYVPRAIRRVRSKSTK
jgi:hypothetical protein